MKIRHSFVSNSSSSSFVISVPHAYSNIREVEEAIEDMVKSLEDACLIMPEEDKKYEHPEDLIKIESEDKETISKYTKMIKSGRKVLAIEFSTEDGPETMLEMLESHGILRFEGSEGY